LTSPAASGRVYTLADQQFTFLEAARMAARAFPRSGPVVRVPEWIVRMACRWHRIVPVRVYPDQFDRLRAPRAVRTPEAKEDLGFQPRSFEDGLAGLDQEPV
jgi:nucleoside-diphosphate-sugar epimerase